MSRGDLSENLDPNLPKVCPVPFYHWASPNPNDLKPVLLGNSRPTWCLGDVEDVNDVSWSFGRCLFMLRFVFFCKENILKWRILEGISPKGATTLLYQKWSKNSQEKQLPQDLALWGETPQLHTSSSAHGCQTEIGWEIPSEFYPFLIFSQTKSNERKSQNFPRRSKKKWLTGLNIVHEKVDPLDHNLRSAAERPCGGAFSCHLDHLFLFHLVVTQPPRKIVPHVDRMEVLG